MIRPTELPLRAFKVPQKFKFQFKKLVHKASTALRHASRTDKIFKISNDGHSIQHRRGTGGAHKAKRLRSSLPSRVAVCNRVESSDSSSVMADTTSSTICGGVGDVILHEFCEMNQKVKRIGDELQCRFEVPAWHTSASQTMV